MKCANLLTEDACRAANTGGQWGCYPRAGQGASVGTGSTGRSLLNNPMSQKGRTLDNAQLRNISVPGRSEQEGGEAQASCKELQKGQKTQVKQTEGLQA